jgi:hypothetical protein
LKNKNLFLTTVEAGKSQDEGVISVPGKGLLPGLQMNILLCPHMTEKEFVSLLSFLFPFFKAAPS